MVMMLRDSFIKTDSHGDHKKQAAENLVRSVGTGDETEKESHWAFKMKIKRVENLIKHHFGVDSTGRKDKRNDLQTTRKKKYEEEEITA